MVQEGIDDWAKTVIATGGNIKITKSHAKVKAPKWTTSLRSKGFLKPQDGWKSLNTQLKPKLEYGLVALCAKPKTLDKLMSRIQHEALSPLGFDQKIYKELRTIHAMYQGIGMFDLNNSCMEFKIHLMREYWNKENCLGEMMRMAYETFLVDVGGNVFCRNYKKL